jgi:hypothetical protein
MIMAFSRRELLFHLHSPMTLRHRLRRDGLQGQSTCQVVPVCCSHSSPQITSEDDGYSVTMGEDWLCLPV